MLATIPHAVSARYDRRNGRVVVVLSTGLEISFLPRDAQGLETAAEEQLQKIKDQLREEENRYNRLSIDATELRTTNALRCSTKQLLKRHARTCTNRTTAVPRRPQPPRINRRLRRSNGRWRRRTISAARCRLLALPPLRRAP